MKQTVSQLHLGFHDNQPVDVTFDGPTISSDGGLLLLRQVDDELGLSDWFSWQMPDERDQERLRHDRQEQVRQRMFQIACGYEDCNDADLLRHDPMLKTVCDRSPGRCLRLPAHFLWWDLSGLSPCVPATPPPEGILALESAKGAPVATGLERFIQRVKPHMSTRMDILPFAMKNQWDYLRSNPQVKTLRYRVGINGLDGDGTDTGELYYSNVGGAEDLEVLVKPKRGRTLNILSKLGLLRARVDSGDRIGVDLTDGRSLWLDDPQYRLRVSNVPCTDGSRSVSRWDMWEAIRDNVLGIKAVLGESVGRQWPQPRTG